VNLPITALVFTSKRDKHRFVQLFTRGD